MPALGEVEPAQHVIGSHVHLRNIVVNDLRLRRRNIRGGPCGRYSIRQLSIESGYIISIIGCLGNLPNNLIAPVVGNINGDVHPGACALCLKKEDILRPEDLLLHGGLALLRRHVRQGVFHFDLEGITVGNALRNLIDLRHDLLESEAMDADCPARTGCGTGATTLAEHRVYSHHTSHRVKLQCRETAHLSALVTTRTHLLIDEGCSCLHRNTAAHQGDHRRRSRRPAGGRRAP